MSQIDIMEYFDENPGTYYTAKQLIKKLNLNRSTINRQLKKILKREEYIAIMKKKEGIQYTLHYGVKIK